MPKGLDSKTQQRLAAIAKNRAVMEIKNRHFEEYREVYRGELDRLYKEAGVEPLRVPEGSN